MRKRLVLRKETLVELRSGELRGVVGGGPTDECTNACTNFCTYTATQLPNSLVGCTSVVSCAASCIACG